MQGTCQGEPVSADLVVHHLDHSRSFRIVWLLEELGLTYEVVDYRRDPKTLRAPRSLRDVHPLGKAPVVVIGDRVLAESGAILQTLVEEYGDAALRPQPGTAEADRYRYFLHYAEGSLMPPLLVSLIVRRIEKAPVPFFLRPVVKSIGGRVRKAYVGPELARHAGFLEEHLASRPWFAGEAFSAADIAMAYGVGAGLQRGFEGDLPNLRDWARRCAEREAHQRATARVGSDEAL